MNYRALGRTPWKVSDISFGAWAIGGAWGHVSDDESLAALNQAIDSGVNFIDTADVYSRENLNAWIDRSLKNLSADTIDLVQLHCPPTELYNRAEVFGMLDDLVKAGKIRYYGVSVEKVEEALKAIEYPNLQTVQIIFNCFRQRPAEEFFPNSKDKKVGILARVPLASGLLTGKFTRASSFPKD